MCLHLRTNWLNVQMNFYHFLLFVIWIFFPIIYYAFMCHGIICDQNERLERRTQYMQLSSLLKSFVSASLNQACLSCTNTLSYNCLKQIKYVSTHLFKLYLTVGDIAGFTNEHCTLYSIIIKKGVLISTLHHSAYTGSLFLTHLYVG